MLLVSLSANVYLAWVAWESRLRYRELLAEHGTAPMANLAYAITRDFPCRVPLLARPAV